MKKWTIVCDLCGKEEKKQGGHAHANNISEENKIYDWTDTISLPAGWVVVGVNCVCVDCINSIKEYV